MVRLQSNPKFISCVLLALEQRETTTKGQVLLWLSAFGVVKHSRFNDDEIAVIPLPWQSAAEIVLITSARFLKQSHALDLLYLKLLPLEKMHKRLPVGGSTVTAYFRNTTHHELPEYELCFELQVVLNDKLLYLIVALGHSK